MSPYGSSQARGLSQQERGDGTGAHGHNGVRAPNHVRDAQIVEKAKGLLVKTPTSCRTRSPPFPVPRPRPRKVRPACASAQSPLARARHRHHAHLERVLDQRRTRVGGTGEKPHHAKSMVLGRPPDAQVTVRRSGRRCGAAFVARAVDGKREVRSRALFGRGTQSSGPPRCLPQAPSAAETESWSPQYASGTTPAARHVSAPLSAATT